jgi:predicted transcriptional regulator
MERMTPVELEVMRILWQHGPLKPSEIQAKYPRPIQNAALRFQLRVLLQKKHLRRRKIGKAYHYQATTSRQSVFRRMARRMAEVFCRGSAAGLVAELIRSEKLSPDELKALQRLAAGRPAGARSARGQGEGA